MDEIDNTHNHNHNHNQIKYGNPYTIFKKECKDGFVIEINDHQQIFDRIGSTEDLRYEVVSRYGMSSYVCFKTYAEAEEMANALITKHS